MANWGWMYIAHCNTVFWQVCPALLCFLESVWLSYFSCLLPVCPSQIQPPEQHLDCCDHRSQGGVRNWTTTWPRLRRRISLQVADPELLLETKLVTNSIWGICDLLIRSVDYEAVTGYTLSPFWNDKILCCSSEMPREYAWREFPQAKMYPGQRFIPFTAKMQLQQAPCLWTSSTLYTTFCASHCFGEEMNLKVKCSLFKTTHELSHRTLCWFMIFRLDLKCFPTETERSSVSI